MNLSSVRIVLGAVSLGVLLLACDNDPAKGKAVATAAPAASTASITAATTTAGSANYTFSNDGSQVAFVGAKVTGKHDGRSARSRARSRCPTATSPRPRSRWSSTPRRSRPTPSGSPAT